MTFITFPVFQQETKLRQNQGYKSDGCGHYLEKGKNLPPILGQEGSVGQSLVSAPSALKTGLSPLGSTAHVLPGPELKHICLVSSDD